MAKNHGNGQQTFFNSVSDRNEKYVVGNLQKKITLVRKWQELR